MSSYGDYSTPPQYVSPRERQASAYAVPEDARGGQSPYGADTGMNPYATSAPVTSGGAGQSAEPSELQGYRDQGWTVFGSPETGYYAKKGVSIQHIRGADPAWRLNQPEGAHPQYLQDIQDVLAAQEGAQVRGAGLSSQIYGNGDPLSMMYGRLNAEQAARDRYPGIIAGAVQAHHQMRDQQAWQLYLSQLQHQWEKEMQPKHNYWNDILGLGGEVLTSYLPHPRRGQSNNYSTSSYDSTGGA